MERSNVQTSRRWEAIEVATLLLWLVALISYFSPWIARKPVSAALAWNAYDMFDLLRFLPEIETGAIRVNLQALRLPLVGLAVLLPLLLAGRGTWVRVGGALLGCALAMLTFPPYPQILTAWRTPGWRVPFWWAVGACVSALGAAWAGPRFPHTRLWAILGIAEITLIPAAVTLRRLLPPLRTLHAAWVRPGWGFWGCLTGLGALGAMAWVQAAFPAGRRRGGPDKSMRFVGDMEGGDMEKEKPYPSGTSPDPLSRIREVKAKYEAQLLAKANVVAVGIGIPMQEGVPTGTPGIIVSVTHKAKAEELTAEDLVPHQLEEVPVWVEEVDRPQAAAGEVPEDR